MANPIMVQGTSSGAGKTILVTALCRIFAQDGYSVAPFKSQNMTANTSILRNGDEIATSQVLQAHASGIEPDARMNPVVLKPSVDGRGAGIILNGRPSANVDSRNMEDIKGALMDEISKAYNSLAAQYDVIVIEGAGSPVELNLNKNDIVNMGVAKLAGAPVLLVSDIDRGGVFASLYGTVALMDDVDRRYVKGVIVNRFRGDVAYFSDGIDIIERVTGVPVAGIVPFFQFSLPEEDSLSGPVVSEAPPFGSGAFEAQLDLVADTVRSSLDMRLVYEILEKKVGVSFDG